MRRDKLLVHEILQHIQEMERLQGVDERNLETGVYGPGFDDEDATFAYHMRLLVNGGFITAELDKQTYISTYRMTWSGHDLLDHFREDMFKE